VAETIRQCAWCKKIWDGKKWVPHPEVLPGATHGMCEPCYKKQLKDWNLVEPNPAGDKLVGATIVRIRTSTAQERKAFMWSKPFIVIELSTGALIFASSDEEMNESGVLNYSDKNGVYTLFS
jgi:hypothetical protein